MSRAQRLFFAFWFLIPLSALGQNLHLATDESPFFRDQYLQRVVIDGEPVDENSPAVASIVQVIVRGDEQTLRCTGVIVSSHFIMTSGHCLDISNSGVQIRFTHSEEDIISDVLDYRSVYKGPPTTGADAFVNGYLPYDRQRAFNFYDSIENRRRWVNFPEHSSQMMDLALIKVNRIPSGSRPLRFYQGDLSFRQEVVVVGYGINSRREEEVDSEAYFSYQRLIGFVQQESDNILGWQTYSPLYQTICYGDSGGPLLIRNQETQEWEILGILTATSNGCANSGFSTYPLSDELEFLTKEWVEQMNSTQEL